MDYTPLKEVKLFTGEKVICEHCGWPKRFYNREVDRLICSNCHQWIYKDEKTKMKYKIKEIKNKTK
mgnify:CR=1 FL=1